MILSIVILFSLIMGSFSTNVVSYFSGRSGFDWLRSKCHCGERVLSIKELIPVVSYFQFSGRCTKCENFLPLYYPVLEILMPLIGTMLFLAYELETNFIFYFAFINLLIAVAVIDYLTFTIPNALVLLLLAISILKTALFPEDFLINVISVIVIITLFVLVYYLMFFIKGIEAMGFGDIKLIGALSLFTGFPLSLIALWFSALIALPGSYIIKKIDKNYYGENKIPFGFFLGIGFTICILLKEHIENLLTIYMEL